MFYMYLIILSLLAASQSILVQKRKGYSQYYQPSAASPTQIKYAEEQNYDDTGPGAKEAETGYKTYNTFEEVVFSYLDDKDTHLPDSETVQRLTGGGYNYDKPVKSFPGLHNDGFKFNNDLRKDAWATFGSDASSGIKNFGVTPWHQGFLKSNPNSRKPISYSSFNRFPGYSYGVLHDSGVGTQQSHQQWRPGGAASGAYAMSDADGRRRTVSYTADDTGFRALLHRS